MLIMSDIIHEIVGERARPSETAVAEPDLTLGSSYLAHRTYR